MFGLRWTLTQRSLVRCFAHTKNAKVSTEAENKVPR